MTEKERYIKEAFENYRENKKKYPEMSFVGVRGVDYSRLRVSGLTPQGSENAIVGYLDEKETIRKQIELVDQTIWWYEADKSGKIAYLTARWVKGYTIVRAAVECYVSERTARTWGKEILKRAARVADVFGLWT
ncbi:MAG: hypothetical protein IJY62_03115 [Clostridia bacterium]|nr:hypothetical protein [Clostridia bacterium]